jgi:hypothetical protein
LGRSYDFLHKRGRHRELQIFHTCNHVREPAGSFHRWGVLPTAKNPPDDLPEVSIHRVPRAKFMKSDRR